MQVIATKTLKAIEDALSADNCGQFRKNLEWLLPKMADAYRGEEDAFRNHMGASGIGDECARKVQLRWLWVEKPNFPERVLRLFNRGHLEEARFLSMLLCVAGVQLWYETEDGGQFKWSDHGGHYGSALDGIATGIPDVPAGAPCYTEFKTAGEKAFKEFQRNGCEVSNHTYYVQTQECMKYYNLPFTLFMVVNKNTDELYAEIITYDAAVADEYSGRAKRIMFGSEAEPRISNTKTFFKCKFCDVRDVCHGSKVPEVNCRTCAHWSAVETGGYSCERGNGAVHQKETSMLGCDDHVFNPTLLPKYSFMGGHPTDNYSVLRDRMGNEIKQGPLHVTSHELYLASRGN